MPKPKPFIFNDESVENHYGFFILTEGISLVRFEKNPVMLSNHWNYNESVLGHWENWFIQDSRLLGYPVFDTEDEYAKLIAGKVERNHIKGCSMGIIFDPEDLVYVGGKFILMKCELTEVSIVAVPSNKASVQLYKKDNEPFSDIEIQSLCLSLKNKNSENPELEIKTETMKKITLSLAALAALSFDKSTPEVDVEAVETAVLKLGNENAQLKAKNLTLESAAEAEQETKITAMVELAIKEGRIPATKKDDFVNLAKANFDLAKSTIEGIPAKVNLSTQIQNPTGGATEVTSKEAFLKLSTAEQLQFKAEKPEEYKKLFTKTK
ncbi:HK97 family phage prohead protease [Flavobacterium aestivum]|uniref:HK97 family phage prohead protease n=1 Tax=Flavobacterium aestivum TaxID=3003257 RepID=UPI0022867F66|nr:HK97 family phage prohead protease [Flavobacterium aestivum]